ncbi:helix-turn-helix transcriptional regulator [Amycolatopsis sp. H20-H5]|uniref:helix-turn-helix transcriptional regulator n=1 Tax=Amycolatopsis sp. H20-H5 TaxID=3046309 RepID=UPI002DB7EF11|nr:WYL domain-containing protein [Amycolatopsis sp. H20-H5]MEC3975116.1 WYL domain-containing protein [Amycolatopsis sp. H20-H5]
MRAERLVALLFTLQSKRSATAAELAEALGVSERTMHRDLSALRDSGVPLWTETGRHGGVRLVEGWRARLDGLTGREAVALFALGVPDALAGLGLGTAVSAAHAKVSASLPKDLRDQAEHVAGRFHLDAPRWFAATDEASELAVVARAVWARHRLNVRYQRRDKVAERLLEPLGLVLKAGVWYLVARVPEDDALRTYRVSRIVSAEEVDERFERPAGFNLARWWRDSSANFERMPLRLTVKVRLSRAGVRSLRRLLGPDESSADAFVSLGPADAEGWADAELALENRDIGLSQLTSIGAEVEILEPADLRAALAETGAAIAARNAPR